MKHFHFSILGLLLFCLPVKAQQIINYDSLKTHYPKYDGIALSVDVHVEYFFEDGKLKAKSTTANKILVLKNKIQDFQTVEIPFNNFEKVNFLSGKLFTLNAAGQKKLTENLKFMNASDKDYYIKNIFYNDMKLKTLAPTTEVTEKCVIEYSYETTYEDLKFLNSFYASEGYPTLDYTFTVSYPEKVNVDVLPINFPESVKRQEATSSGEKEIKYNLKNISILSNESFSAPNAYYLPHFIVVTKSYKDDKNAEVKVLESTRELYSWYHSLINELKPDKEYLKKLSDDIIKTAGAATPEKKVEAIFNWVKTNITYVAFEDGIAGFKPEEAQKVEKNRFGDCKGMANLVTELLKTQGFDAHQTWIGTNSLPYSYEIPSLCVDNHMICALLLNGNTYLLDATGKNNDWNKYPYYIENKEALIGMDDSYKIFHVPGSTVNDNVCELNYSLDLSKPEQPAISGAVRLTGAFYKIYKSVAEDVKVEDKKDLATKLLMHLFQHTFLPKEASFTVTESDIKISFKGTADPLVLKSGNSLVIRKAGFEYFPLSFMDDHLNTPLFFEFPFTYKVSSTYSGNYKLASTINYSKTNSISNITQTTSQSGGQVKDEMVFQVTKPIVKTGSFSEWNDILSQYYYTNGLFSLNK